MTRRIGFAAWETEDWAVARDIETFIQQEIRLAPILALPDEDEHESPSLPFPPALPGPEPPEQPENGPPDLPLPPAPRKGHAEPP